MIQRTKAKCPRCGNEMFEYSVNGGIKVMCFTPMCYRSEVIMPPAPGEAVILDLEDDPKDITNKGGETNK